jgi:hypothetical protein
LKIAGKFVAAGLSAGVPANSGSVVAFRDGVAVAPNEQALGRASVLPMPVARRQKLFKTLSTLFYASLIDVQFHYLPGYTFAVNNWT